MEEHSDMNSEVDVNILINVYNQKISSSTNQNILLEAKIQSILKDYDEEKNTLLMAKHRRRALLKVSRIIKV